MGIEWHLDAEEGMAKAYSRGDARRNGRAFRSKKDVNGCFHTCPRPEFCVMDRALRKCAAGTSGILMNNSVLLSFNKTPA